MMVRMPGTAEIGIKQSETHGSFLISSTSIPSSRKSARACWLCVLPLTWWEAFFLLGEPPGADIQKRKQVMSNELRLPCSLLLLLLIQDPWVLSGHTGVGRSTIHGDWWPQVVTRSWDGAGIKEGLKLMVGWWQWDAPRSRIYSGGEGWGRS